jgi:[acyl-carrier-protein] S-malonyltransferase
MTGPRIPVIGNVHARPMATAVELRADIKAQMQSRVRWTESVGVMLNSGVGAFVELGNESVLAGLIRRIAQPAAGEPAASCYPLGAPEDLAGFAVL